MSRVYARNVDATLSEAKPQDVMVESQNSAVETLLRYLTGVEVTGIHKRQVQIVTPRPDHPDFYLQHAAQ